MSKTIEPVSVTNRLKKANRPVSARELLVLLGLSPASRTDLKRVLGKLVKEKAILKDGKHYVVSSGQFGLASQDSAVPKRSAEGAKARKSKQRKERDAQGLSQGAQAKNQQSVKAQAPDGVVSAISDVELSGESPLAAGQLWFSSQDEDEAKGRKGGAEPSSRLPMCDPVLLGSPRKSEKSSRGGIRYVIGTLRRHAEGFGFVEPYSGGKGPYLPPEEARKALDGDLIKVELVPGYRGRPAGRFVELVEPRRSYVMGIYSVRGHSCRVEPLGNIDPISVRKLEQAVDGDLVKVKITARPDRRAGPSGEIVSIFVDKVDPLARVLEIAYGYGFADEFPSEVQGEALALPEQIGDKEIARRRDLRSLRLVTIDGDDARDFDDAVFVERTRKGFRLVVAIADVAHFVKRGSSLDLEALRRGTSVYFPGFALPMLPELLSNGLCSLKPGEERLCLVADLVFEREGAGARCVDADFYEAVMKSAARCTYTEVAELLGGYREGRLEHLRTDFENMESLAGLLSANRSERGAIDFDIPETKAVLDKSHWPIKLERRERNVAHRIIEAFMLAANEAVAKYFSVRGLPTVYRVHGKPDEEKLEIFFGLARAQGFAAEMGEELTGKALNSFLKQIAGSPEQRTLNYLLLRSMMQALYSAQNTGHFGLAAPFYLHFTSPIRRYPDLMVHRLLKEHWARGAQSLAEKDCEAQEELLDGISVRSSERERAAMMSERDAHGYFAALFLKDKVGYELDGSVSAVTDFGLFIELTDIFVEGLLKTSEIGSGGEFDEKRHRLVFPNGISFGLGTKVRVRVAHVDVERRHIDFQLLEPNLGQKRLSASSQGQEKLKKRDRSSETVGTKGAKNKRAKRAKSKSPNKSFSKRRGRAR